MKTTVQRHERPVLPTPTSWCFLTSNDELARTNISPLTPSLCHAGPVASPEEGGGLTAREFAASWPASQGSCVSCTPVKDLRDMALDPALDSESARDGEPPPLESNPSRTSRRGQETETVCLPTNGKRGLHSLRELEAWRFVRTSASPPPGSLVDVHPLASPVSHRPEYRR